MIKTLRWNDYAGLSGWTINPITSILRKERQRDLMHDGGEGSAHRQRLE